MHSRKPHWDEDNLKRHYDKHPNGKDSGCWQELLGSSPSTVSIDDYRQASERVLEAKWLDYEASELDVDAYRRAAGPEKIFHPRGRYYVDQRALLTVVGVDSGKIHTCYHKHFGSKHRAEDTKTPRSQIRVLEDLVNRLRCGMVENLAVKEIDYRGLPRKPINALMDQLKIPS